MFSSESPQWGDSNENTQYTFIFEGSRKDTPIIPPGLALLSTLIGSNNPCLELIFMVPKVFEPLKFYCICLWKSEVSIEKKIQFLIRKTYTVCHTPEQKWCHIIYLSYDVAVFQWITSCHKNRIINHTCNNTLVRMRNFIDNVRVNSEFSHSTNVHFIGDKIPF